jgi:hypothetical protein
MFEIARLVVVALVMSAEVAPNDVVVALVNNALVPMSVVAKRLVEVEFVMSP